MNAPYYRNELYHHGIKGQKWGVRRYQNYDGTLINSSKKKKTKQDYVLEQQYAYYKSLERERNMKRVGTALKLVGTAALIGGTYYALKSGKAGELAASGGNLLAKHIQKSVQKQVDKNTDIAKSTVEDLIKTGENKVQKALNDIAPQKLSDRTIQRANNSAHDKAAQVAKKVYAETGSKDQARRVAAKYGQREYKKNIAKQLNNSAKAAIRKEAADKGNTYYKRLLAKGIDKDTALKKTKIATKKFYDNALANKRLK